jgi:hypothetical protein
MAGLTTPTRARSTPPTPLRALTLLELAGMAGLASMIAIHVTELSGKTDEVAYLGFGYLAMIVASFLSIVMIGIGDRRGWRLAGATAAATLVGYVLTRTSGLPGSHDDVGNWGETLAVWAMVTELGVVALAGIALRPPRGR